MEVWHLTFSPANAIAFFIMGFILAVLFKAWRVMLNTPPPGHDKDDDENEK